MVTRASTTATPAPGSSKGASRKAPPSTRLATAASGAASAPAASAASPKRRISSERPSRSDKSKAAKGSGAAASEEAKPKRRPRTLFRARRVKDKKKKKKKEKESSSAAAASAPNANDQVTAQESKPKGFFGRLRSRGKSRDPSRGRSRGASRNTRAPAAASTGSQRKNAPPGSSSGSASPSSPANRSVASSPGPKRSPAGDSGSVSSAKPFASTKDRSAPVVSDNQSESSSYTSRSTTALSKQVTKDSHKAQDRNVQLGASVLANNEHRKGEEPQLLQSVDKEPNNHRKEEAANYFFATPRRKHDKNDGDPNDMPPAAIQSTPDSRESDEAILLESPVPVEGAVYIPDRPKKSSSSASSVLDSRKTITKKQRNMYMAVGGCLAFSAGLYYHYYSTTPTTIGSSQESLSSPEMTVPIIPEDDAWNTTTGRKIGLLDKKLLREETGIDTEDIPIDSSSSAAEKEVKIVLVENDFLSGQDDPTPKQEALSEESEQPKEPNEDTVGSTKMEPKYDTVSSSSPSDLETNLMEQMESKGDDKKEDASIFSKFWNYFAPDDSDAVVATDPSLDETSEQEDEPVPLLNDDTESVDKEAEHSGLDMGSMMNEEDETLLVDPTKLEVDDESLSIATDSDENDKSKNEAVEKEQGTTDSARSMKKSTEHEREQSTEPDKEEKTDAETSSSKNAADMMADSSPGSIGSSSEQSEEGSSMPDHEESIVSASDAQPGASQELDSVADEPLDEDTKESEVLSEKDTSTFGRLWTYFRSSPTSDPTKAEPVEDCSTLAESNNVSVGELDSDLTSGSNNQAEPDKAVYGDHEEQVTVLDGQESQSLHFDKGLETDSKESVSPTAGEESKTEDLPSTNLSESEEARTQKQTESADNTQDELSLIQNTETLQYDENKDHIQSANHMEESTTIGSDKGRTLVTSQPASDIEKDETLPLQDETREISESEQVETDHETAYDLTSSGKENIASTDEVEGKIVPVKPDQGKREDMKEEYESADSDSDVSKDVGTKSNGPEDETNVSTFGRFLRYFRSSPTKDQGETEPKLEEGISDEVSTPSYDRYLTSSQEEGDLLLEVTTESALSNEKDSGLDSESNDELASLDNEIDASRSRSLIEDTTGESNAAGPDKATDEKKLVMESQAESQSEQNKNLGLDDGIFHDEEPSKIASEITVNTTGKLVESDPDVVSDESEILMHVSDMIPTEGDTFENKEPSTIPLETNEPERGAGGASFISFVFYTCLSFIALVSIQGNLKATVNDSKTEVAAQREPTSNETQKPRELDDIPKSAVGERELSMDDSEPSMGSYCEDEGDVDEDVEELHNSAQLLKAKVSRLLKEQEEEDSTQAEFKGKTREAENVENATDRKVDTGVDDDEHSIGVYHDDQEYDDVDDDEKEVEELHNSAALLKAKVSRLLKEQEEEASVQTETQGKTSDEDYNETSVDGKADVGNDEHSIGSYYDDKEYDDEDDDKDVEELHNSAALLKAKVSRLLQEQEEEEATTQAVYDGTTLGHEDTKIVGEHKVGVVDDDSAGGYYDDKDYDDEDVEQEIGIPDRLVREQEYEHAQIHTEAEATTSEEEEARIAEERKNNEEAARLKAKAEALLKEQEEEEILIRKLESARGKANVEADVAEESKEAEEAARLRAKVEALLREQHEEEQRPEKIERRRSKALAAAKNLNDDQKTKLRGHSCGM